MRRGKEGCGCEERCAMRDPLLAATLAPSPPRLRIQLRGYAAPPGPVRLPARIAVRLAGVDSGLAGRMSRDALGSASDWRRGRRGHFGAHPYGGSGAPRTRGRIQPVRWPGSLLCFNPDLRGNGDLCSRSDAFLFGELLSPPTHHLDRLRHHCRPLALLWLIVFWSSLLLSCVRRSRFIVWSLF